MLDAEELDDELFFVIVPAVMSCLYDEKMPDHTSSLPGATKVKEILEGHKNCASQSFEWRLRSLEL